MPIPNALIELLLAKAAAQFAKTLLQRDPLVVGELREESFGDGDQLRFEVEAVSVGRD
ncbi:MAG: hypothetical protein O3A46_10165 [Candidatus Poribacteria bacterium]|nr:hypothetical protein [Candidatus Poribacteria bacterium]